MDHMWSVGCTKEPITECLHGVFAYRVWGTRQELGFNTFHFSDTLEIRHSHAEYMVLLIDYPTLGVFLAPSRKSRRRHFQANK